MKIPQILAATAFLMVLGACEVDQPTPVAPDIDVRAHLSPVDGGRFLVEYTGKEGDLTAAVEAAGGRLGRVHRSIGVAEVAGLDEQKLKQLPGVQYATADVAMHAVQSYPIERGTDAYGFAIRSYELDPALEPTGEPTDAYLYACQWNLRQMHAEGAWDAGARGEGIKVALLDTGVDIDHVDLAGKVDLAQSTSVLTYEGYGCPADDGTTITDYLGHGTMTSGAVTSNSIGIAAPAPDARLVMVKTAARDGWATEGDLLAGLLYAADLEDVDVISISLVFYLDRGAPGSNRLMAMVQKAVNYATRQGKLIIGTAGNDGMDLGKMKDEIIIPTSLANVKSAYATDHLDQLPVHSNYGVSNTWVGAGSGTYGDHDGEPIPGCPVALAVQNRIPLACSSDSWLLADLCNGSNSAYIYFGAGTSFATPQVAAVAALVDGTRGGGFNPHQLASILAQTADDLGEPGVDNLFSHGRVNAARAVQRR